MSRNENQPNKFQQEHLKFEINDRLPGKQSTTAPSTVDNLIEKYSVDHSQKGSVMNFKSESLKGLDETESKLCHQLQSQTHKSNLLEQQVEFPEFQPEAHESNSVESLVASGKLVLRQRRNKLTLKKLDLNLPIIDREYFERVGDWFAKGGQAKVYKSKMRGTDVALKTFEKNNKFYTALKEMKLLTRIRHPNIISIMAVAEGYTDYAIVMEFYDSYTLRQVVFYPNVKSVYKLNQHHKINIVRQLCLALNYLHLDKEPIIHRDVKPENVLVEWTGDVRLIYNIKLCDLGMSVCKNLMSELKTSENNCGPKGTEFYLAPELVKRQQPDTKSDVWAAACTILELYSEKEVWDFGHSDIQTNLVAEALLKGQSPKVINVPGFIKHTLTRCFSHNPSIRPSIQDILDIVEDQLEFLN